VRSRSPITMGAIDGAPVSDALALLVPTPVVEADSRLLWRLVDCLSRPDVARRLKSLSEAGSVRQWLTGCG